METASDCQIARLPVELLSAVISRTSPREAFRSASVSPAFRAAADSDTVWSCFLPAEAELPPLADGELQPAPLSKKEMFIRLADGPILLASRRMSMWLDRDTGKKCYMLAAKALRIWGSEPFTIWGEPRDFWRWIPLTNSRFTEAAELLDCWRLEIRGKMDAKMLSENTKYAAYIVFKIVHPNYGLDAPLQEATVSIGERRSTRQACLGGCDSEAGNDEVPESSMQLNRMGFSRRSRRPLEAQLPQRRADGWLELEMGSFFNEGVQGMVSISLTETEGTSWKKGLIVHGIEIRVKDQI